MVIGYRHGHSIQDAIFNLCKEVYKGKCIILKTDIQNFFENVSHKAILSQITFPQSFIKKLLKIKIRVQGKEHKNKKGLIQGNPLSPVLANIALYGMKNKIIPELNQPPFLNTKTKFYYLRYADDILILAANRRILENKILPNLIEFLKTKNLELNHDKTQIRKLEQGFEYLGYYIKQIGNALEAKPLKEGYGYSILITKN